MIGPDFWPGLLRDSGEFLSERQVEVLKRMQDREEIP
jgi:hypothetical protein